MPSVKIPEISELALEHRAGLPEALKVLLKDYPREAWEAEPGFSALIRFWLDRHLMFRKLVANLKADGAALANEMDAGPPKRRLQRYGGLLVQELHMHHTIEDQEFFPKMRVLQADIEVGFDLMDADHQVLDHGISEFAAATNAVLQNVPQSQASFEVALNKLERVLNRHLEDEEELIVPVLLKYGSVL